MQSQNRALALATFLVIITVAAPAAAQDPLVVAPKAYKLQFENDWVRVVRVHYAPFEKLPVHDHPKRQSIFVYLNDGGPVRFKHVEGVSGDYSAVRPPTRHGAYRLAGIQPENHIVENLSDVPSDFLQVELKTEAVEMKSFRGRFFPEFGIKQEKGSYRKVEFENDQVRITRLVCGARIECAASDSSPHPGLVVALSPLLLKAVAKSGGPSQLKLGLGESSWLEAGERRQWQNLDQAQAHHLLIEFKTRPAKTTSSAEKHKH